MAVNVQLIFGPMLLGVCGNLILYGVLLLQMHTWVTAYKNDPFRLKLLIYYLFLVETASTALNIYLIYEPLVHDVGHDQARMKFPTALCSVPITTVAIATPIQLFVAYRIRLLSRSWVVPSVIALLSFLSTAGGILVAIRIFELEEFHYKPQLHLPALIWLVSAAVNDVLITVALCYNLWKNKTGMISTDSRIARITKLTVQTGFITAAFAILDVMCFLILPRTTINFIWSFALGKLYSNVLLSTLNSRPHLRSHFDRENVLFGSQDNYPRDQPHFATLTEPEFAVGGKFRSPRSSSSNLPSTVRTA